MRSPFASLRILVLPVGAIVGPHLILDGTNGRIEAYDVFNDRVVVIDSQGVRAQVSDTGGFVLLDPTTASIDLSDALAAQPGTITADTVAGAPRLTLRSPYDLLAERASIEIASDAPSFVDLEADDVRHNGVSLPRGILPAGLFRSTGNDAARAAGVATDATVTVALEAGRTYRVHAHSQFNVGTAGAVYALDLDYDGAIIGRFGRWSAAETPAGSTTCHVDGAVVFTAGVDDAAATLTLENSAGSGGTVTLTAGATNPRTLSVEDIGGTP